MTLKHSKLVTAPHIRYPESTRIIMADALLTMSFVYIMCFYYYGGRALMLAAVSVTASVLADVIFTLLFGRKPHPRDFSAVVTGLMLPLLMPASIPYHIVVTAAVFGILVAKQIFGGVGHNVFNPVAAGFCFAVISFPEGVGQKVFSFPQPLALDKLPLFGKAVSSTGVSAAFTVSLGGVPKVDAIEMLLGNMPGPMGATNILVVCACLLYLVLRNTVRWKLPATFFATVMLFAYLFPRQDTAFALTHMDRMRSVMLELMSGSLLFGGAFLLGDPVTTPKRDWSKVAFAFTAGIVVMLFRRFGRFEEPFCFALLLMNATVWGFDMLGERVASMIRRRRFGHIDRKKA